MSRDVPSESSYICNIFKITIILFSFFKLWFMVGVTDRIRVTVILGQHIIKIFEIYLEIACETKEVLKFVQVNIRDKPLLQLEQ